MKTSALIGAILLAFGLNAVAQTFTPEPVQWQDFVKTSASNEGSPSGSSLSRNGSAAAWNADAISTKWIVGDGWVEFRFDQLNKNMAVGLAAGNPDRTWTNFSYAIHAASGVATVREAGVTKSIGQTFAVTDVFRIERVGGKVVYKKNGSVVTLDEPSTPSQGVLMVDSAFHHPYAGISGCKIASLSNPSDIRWYNHNNLSSGIYGDGGAGSTVQKDGAASAWDTDPFSSQAILGDGFFRFRFGQTNKTLAAGLSDQDTSHSFTDIRYGFTTSGGGIMDAIVNGAVVTLNAAYTVDDVLSIRRSGTTVTYLVNEAVIHTETNASTVPLFADVALFSPDAKITNCQLDGYPLADSVIFSTGSSVDFRLRASGGSIWRWTGTAAWDAGAYLDQPVPASSAGGIEANGMLSFRFAQNTGANAAVGLAAAKGSISLNDLSFAVVGRADGQLEIFESGQSAGTFGAYVPSDLLAVRRLNGTIEYTQNGVVLRQVAASGSLGTSALWGAVCIHDVGGQVDDLQLYTGETDLHWRKRTQTTATFAQDGLGSRLARGGAAAGWTADAHGSRKLVGDGYVQWQVAPYTNKDVRVGLGPWDRGNGTDGLLYSIFWNGTNSELKVQVDGTAIHTASLPTTADSLRIRRRGQDIVFSVISAAGVESVLASTVLPAGEPDEFLVDCSMQDPNVTIDNCRIHYRDADGDGLDDAWEVSEFGSLAQNGTGLGGDFDSDAVDNLHEFLNGSDPADFFNGTPPQVVKISGDIQYADAGQFAALPLVVEVRESGLPAAPVLVNVPVTFSVTTGTATLAETSGGPTVATLLAWTDGNGRAEVFFKQAPSVATESVFQAYAGVHAGESNTVQFTAPTADLRAFWMFDEESGSAILDDSNSSPKNDGQLMGGAVREVSFDDSGGVFDKAIRLNGTSGYATVPTAPSLDFTGSPFTVIGWVQLDWDASLAAATDVYPIVSKWSATGYGFELAAKGGASKGLSFTARNNGLVVEEIVPQSDLRALLLDGRPHQVAFTRDASNVARLYFDGALVNSQPSFSSPIHGGAPVLMGTSAASHYWRGALDDVRLFASPMGAITLWENFDSDSDLLPDWWEFKILHGLGFSGYEDLDSDGVTNYEEYLDGSDPNSGFSSGRILLQKTGGDGQIGPANSYLPQPLKLLATNALGDPLPNTNVSIFAGPGGGQLGLTANSPTRQSLWNVQTDASGIAEVYYYQPGFGATASTVVAKVVGGSTVTFNAFTDPLVGYWKLNAASGTMATDDSGAGNDATVGGDGSVSWSGPSFNGTGGVAFGSYLYTAEEGLQVPNANNEVLPATGKPFTLSFWFQSNTLTSGRLYTLATNETAGTSGFRFGIDTGAYVPGPARLKFWTTESGGGLSINGATTIQANTWYHVSVAYDGSQATVYLNGKAEASGSGNLLGNTNALRFGTGIASSYSLDGSLDEVRVFAKELPAAEVLDWAFRYGNDADSDADGLPDGWEYRYFGNLTATAAGDDDGDGLTNLQEFQLRRNPNAGAQTNPNSEQLTVFTPLE